MRLQRFLAQCGVASRREAEDLIASGRAAINGVPAKIGDTVNPDVDEVAVDGVPVRREENVYVLLHKPADAVTTVKDTHNRKTVLDYVTGVGARIVPVGRLDKDVTGALILTNDGELAQRLTHPSYEVDKVYEARVRGRMAVETALRLEAGVALDDGETAPATVSILETSNRSTLVRIVVHEGRKRLIKRMCAAVGHPVRELRRVSIGSISADTLSPGQWRYLSQEEVEGLRTLTGLMS